MMTITGSQIKISSFNSSTQIATSNFQVKIPELELLSLMMTSQDISISRRPKPSLPLPLRKMLKL